MKLITREAHPPHALPRALAHALVVALIAIGFGLSAVRPAPAGAAFVMRGHAAASAQHLYVSDPVGHRVLRFALTAGIPAQQPDAMLGGFKDPLGVAVGPTDGRLYVVDARALELLIYEPAPTGSSKPSHVLSLQRHRFGRGAVAVDQNGMVYVGYTAEVGGTSPHPNPNVAIYAPLPSGTQRPVGFVNWYDGTGPFGIAVNSQQIAVGLGFGAFDGPILAFADLARRDRDIAVLPCAANVPFGVAWDSNTLYIADQGTNGGEPEINVLPPITHDCAGEYAITSSTVPIDHPEGVAANGGLLYAASAFNKQVGSAVVFVFDPKLQGAQTPKAVLGGPSSGLNSAYGVAIGP